MKRRWLLLAFLVGMGNFIWEMVQAPLYADMRVAPFWSGTVRCLQAAFGDVAVAAIAFAAAALSAQRIDWPQAKRLSFPLFIFVGTGLLITIVLERWSIAQGRWSYDMRMPTMAGVGIAPLLQWVILPLLEIVALRLTTANRWLFPRRQTSI